LASVGVDPEVLQHKRKGAGGRVIFGELVVIEVISRRIVFVADIHDGDLRIVQIGGGGFAPNDGHGVQGEQDTAGEELVFMGAAGMGE
jgi:hypothetical protein